MIDIQPNDRVLLLSVPEISLVLELARKATRGIVVGLAEGEQLQAARRAVRECDNVMFVPATPDEIPWQDGFFSKLVDQRMEWEPPARVLREIVRVLSPGGVACLRVRDRQLLAAAGLEELPAEGTFRVFQKPAPAAGKLAF